LVRPEVTTKAGRLRPLRPDHPFYPRSLPQSTWAAGKALGVPVAIEDAATGIAMVLVPGGTSPMGASSLDDEAYDDEKPQHSVTLQPFYLGIGPVTQSQWERVMGANPSHFKGAGRPVESVSWNDARAFLGKLNAGRTETSLRLPAEAEWERAARAGIEERYWWGREYASGMAKCTQGLIARLMGASSEVGRHGGNQFGLLDMLGNVWEWCQDGYHLGYRGAPADGRAWELAVGGARVARGGSWSASPRLVRVSSRLSYPAGYVSSDLGFRVAQDVPAQRADPGLT
jgi:formylglycine-generating enzyme required for sulfatase activity